MATEAMPRMPKFQPIETAAGWMLSVPGAMTDSGEREREFYPEQKDADKRARFLRGKYQRGERGTVIDRDLADMAIKAAEILKPIGLTIMDVAKAAVTQFNAADSTETFNERYLKAMAEGETRWRPIYAKDMSFLPLRVGKKFMVMRCSTITPEIIRKALVDNGSKTQATIQHRARYVSAILNFKPRHRKTREIEIMTSEQCEKMICAAKTQENRWVVAILLFAGIRPSVDSGEISRLEWGAFGENEIYISGDVSKTGTDRHIPITPRLRRLIAGHPRTGPVLPSGWAKNYRLIRIAADISKDHDITRHTFASHFLAAYGEKATKDAMGHTANSNTLFRHYRRAVVEAAGVKYFR